MILVTVGGQMPFDRLIRTVDGWAASRGRKDLFAQVGPKGFRPTAFESTEMMTPSEFGARVKASRAIIGHAGMGTILTALQHAKPLVILPRRAEFEETRNDHQVACARHFEAVAGVLVAITEDELPDRLDALDRLSSGAPIPPVASEELIGFIRGFIEAE